MLENLFENGVEFGIGEMRDGIGILPLRLKKVASNSIVAITSALDQGIVEILESESVNTLKLKINTPDTQILIPFLQVVGGGKQDRMITKPILIQGNKDDIIEIPVNCVEQGRWGYTRQTTGVETNQQFFAHKKVRMSPSMGSVNAMAAQHKTWGSVNWYQNKKKISTEKYATQSFMEVEEAVHGSYEDEKSSKVTNELRDLIQGATTTLKDQTGLAFFVGEILQAIELYGNSQLWKSQLEAVKNSFLSEIDLHDKIDTTIESGALKKLLLEQISKVQLNKTGDETYGSLKVASDDNAYASLALEYQNTLVEFYYAPKSAELQNMQGPEIIPMSNVAGEQVQQQVQFQQGPLRNRRV